MITHACALGRVSPLRGSSRTRIHRQGNVTVTHRRIVSPSHSLITYQPWRLFYPHTSLHTRTHAQAGSGGTENDNVINAHDMGREVQLSFYDGPSFYNPPTPAYPNGACNKLFGGQPWPWNPIGAGDVDGNHGEVLSFDKHTDSAGRVTGWHIVSRPLQWACHNVSCECTFEQNVTTVDGVPAGTGVKLTSTLHNHRSDPTVYLPRDQELPATYV